MADNTGQQEMKLKASLEPTPSHHSLALTESSPCGEISLYRGKDVDNTKAQDLALGQSAGSGRDDQSGAAREP